MRPSGRFALIALSVWLLLTSMASASEEAEAATRLTEENAGESTVPGFEDLFRINSVRHAVMSPGGIFSAYASYDDVLAGNAEFGFHTVETTSKANTIINVEWISDDTLIVTTSNNQSREWILHVVQIGVESGEVVQTEHKAHTVDGFVYDRLPDDPDRIILGKFSRRNDKLVADLFRFKIYGDEYLQTKKRLRLVKDTDELLEFVRDSEGDFFLGTSVASSRPVIWQKRGKRRGEWNVVWTGPVDSTFTPIGLSADEKILWAISDATTDRVAAVAFDLGTMQIADVLFEHSRFDLSNIIFDEASSRPVGVSFLKAGLIRYHYFDNSAEQKFKRIQEMLPDSSVIITGYSEDRLHYLVYATSPQDPGSLHACDLIRNECALIAPTKPWLVDKTLAETTTLTVTSEDGLVIDAFVTLPPEPADSVPLVVMPHGGPIGVSDDQYFSPDVQWLARNAYAVLQVNYRGSSGYGKEFRSAGLREWGRGIEADIRAALALALEQFPQIDSDRICIYGGSYGGYSALISVIENPELFKCAASYAGVTDLTLLFNRSGLRQNQAMTDRLVKMIGDPALDYDELVRYSPVYQYRNIRRPVFIAHGNNDSIVDVEHSWRLRTMLNLADIRPEFLVLEDVGHGFEYVEDAALLYGPLIAFLDSHLKSSASTPQQQTSVTDP